MAHHIFSFFFLLFFPTIQCAPVTIDNNGEFASEDLSGIMNGKVFEHAVEVSSTFNLLNQ